jgi:hypothetical protein
VLERGDVASGRKVIKLEVRVVGFLLLSCYGHLEFEPSMAPPFFEYFFVLMQ